MSPFQRLPPHSGLDVHVGNFAPDCHLLWRANKFCTCILAICSCTYIYCVCDMLFYWGDMMIQLHDVGQVVSDCELVEIENIVVIEETKQDIFKKQGFLIVDIDFAFTQMYDTSMKNRSIKDTCKNNRLANVMKENSRFHVLHMTGSWSFFTETSC